MNSNGAVQGSFTIAMADATCKFQCTYSFESGVASPKFNCETSGKNPHNYVLQYGRPQVVQGVARITAEITCDAKQSCKSLSTNNNVVILYFQFS